MKLQLMLKPMHDGQLTQMLCDEHGEPLPGQFSLVTETAVDQFATVTVKFCEITFALPPGGV